MDNTTKSDTKAEKDFKTNVVTPTNKSTRFFSNASENIARSVYVNVSHDDEDISTPLDYRRDWSKDLEDADEMCKDSPVSTELYTMLQNTIATIEPYDYSSDDDSCNSLCINNSLYIFNKSLDLNNEREKKDLLKALYHDRSHNVTQAQPAKKRKLN